MTTIQGPTKPTPISDAPHQGSGPGSSRSQFRFAAVLGTTGLLIQIPMGMLHPHRVQPNESAAVFREYEGSTNWAMVHIGQFAGTLLIVLSLVLLARSLSKQPGIAGALGFLGGVTAVLVAGVFAVQMAVDGVALKGAIDAWAGTTSPEAQASAFQVADGIRWLEKALSSFFQLLNGLTFLLIGLSMVVGRSFARWLGVVGVLTGAALVYVGTVVARTGFSPESATAVLPATLLGAVFLIGTWFSMWRRVG